MSFKIEQAVNAFKNGKPVIVYDADGREEECDFLMPAEFCRSEDIQLFRKEAGGLIFLTLPHTVWSGLGLQYMSEILTENSPAMSMMASHSLPYDENSSFSISVNHIDTYTGITDIDRTKTIKSFGQMILDSEDQLGEYLHEEFSRIYRCPGHVPICLASEKILEKRFGHTELATALATIAETSGVCVGCEIMGDEGGSAPRDEVFDYSKLHGIPFLDGKDIENFWRQGKYSNHETLYKELKTF